MSIYKKLFEAKKEIGKISKDTKNPFYKSKYFDINSLLEHVEPILAKNNLIVLQPILDGTVKTIIVDVENEKDSIKSEIALPLLNDPQKLGSAITYYRRYTLQSLLGLQAEDDDGNRASNKQSDRRQALTIEQFEKTKSAEPKQIQAVLNAFRMSQTQREELQKLVK